MPGLYQVGVGTYDTEHNMVVGPTTGIGLTCREGLILRLLLAHEGQVLSSQQIFDRVWGSATDSPASVVTTHIRHVCLKVARAVGTET